MDDVGYIGCADTGGEIPTAASAVSRLQRRIADGENPEFAAAVEAVNCAGAVDRHISLGDVVEEAVRTDLVAERRVAGGTAG